jgi:pimeloyl-ACP methyl ester carboxylesterase
LKLFRYLTVAVAVAIIAGCASNVRSGYEVESIGSFHIGGHQVTLSGLPPREIKFTATEPPLKIDPNGDFETGQMYVQYVKLENPKARYPMLMWHGGGLTGVTWETKPDGQPGWQEFFLRSGFNVYVSDSVERGRASWSAYPQIYKSEPFFRTKKEAWELFRIGPDGSYSTDPAKRVDFPDTQFPVKAFDQFAKQAVPRWSTNDAATQAAYDALVQKVCPCVIVVHSQGSNFAFNAALKAPDKIKAIVAIEPSGAPDPGTINIAAFKRVPFLFVWGDHLNDSPFWKKTVLASLRLQQAIKAEGGTADFISLPKLGIHGNTHMLMMDRNSDQIAGIIQRWLSTQGIMK